MSYNTLGIRIFNEKHHAKNIIKIIEKY